MENDDVIVFGETNFRGEKRRFGVKRSDRRRHMYIIGKTGMGKTTLLENMTIQDIQNGEGVGVVDPHGEYAERMLDFVPQSRIKDVIYFNPSNIDTPIAFNVLEDVGPERRHLVASGLLGVFKKIWPDVWSARMEYLLSNSILALLENQGSTLLGINRMLTDKEYRKSMVKNVTDPIVKAFWENEYASYSERFAVEAGAAVQNKIGQFTSNPLIRNIIGQEKSSIDMRRIMDEKKIFIMNLSKGLVGEENSRLLGAMLITRLYLAAMTRVDMPEEKRADFYLYVDEFQNFATESFANILSEARKYRLNLILAHQYIAQMDEKVQDAVFGNVGSMITFRVGAADAELLEKEFSPEFMIQDIVNLGFASIYLRLMIDSVASRPFSATTLAPVQKDEESHKKEIIQSSSKLYGFDRKEVEKKIMDWQGFGADIKPKESFQKMRLIDIRELGKKTDQEHPPLRVSARPSISSEQDLPYPPNRYPQRPSNTQTFSSNTLVTEKKFPTQPPAPLEKPMYRKEERQSFLKEREDYFQRKIPPKPQQNFIQPKIDNRSQLFDIRRRPHFEKELDEPDKNNKTLSLSTLKPVEQKIIQKDTTKNDGKTELKNQPLKIEEKKSQPEKKSVDFNELKKALTKALNLDAAEEGSALRDHTGMLRPKSDSKFASPKKESGVLKQGEKITFDK